MSCIVHVSKFPFSMKHAKWHLRLSDRYCKTPNCHSKNFREKSNFCESKFPYKKQVDILISKNQALQVGTSLLCFYFYLLCYAAVPLEFTYYAQEQGLLSDYYAIYVQVCMNNSLHVCSRQF